MYQFESDREYHVSIAHDELANHPTTLCDICDKEIIGPVRWTKANLMVCKTCYDVNDPPTKPSWITIGTSAIGASGFGIGATYMQGTKMDFNKANLNNLQVLTDSSEYIKAVSPNIAINAEYRLPISAEMPLAVGIGGQVLYSYYSERQTTTRMDVVDENYNHYKLNPKLSGHMLNPSFYVIIYYRFAGRERY